MHKEGGFLRLVRIKEVAEKAGVSVATVSRVLNQHSSVSEKTRRKIEEAINELNYRPSLLGRNLRTKESRLLLVIIPDISNPFYTEIINGIEETALKKGYNILLCNTDSNLEREEMYFDLMKNRVADGAILMDQTIPTEKIAALASEYPIVQCSEYTEDERITYVSISNEAASYQAVKHLLQIGKKKIAFINSDEQFLYARERRAGYERALTEYNIPINSDLMRNTGGVSFEHGKQAMNSLLKHRPDAVFAVSDVLAIGALKEININSFSVPDDIAIIGFDKIDFSNMTNPPLTTISQPMYKMGATSAELLINKIRGEEVENMILEHELVIREST